MRLYRLLAVAIGILLGTFLTYPGIASPQQTASINGTLTDPSGAPLQGAIITATATGSITGASTGSGITIGRASTSSAEPTQTKSAAEGKYSIMLAPGRYRVSIEYASFARVEQEFAIAAGEKRTWDVRLKLEKMSSQVVVTAAAEPIEAEASPDLVDVITREQIDQRQEVSLVDMLASQAGASFDREGPYGGFTGFFLDGGTSSYTKVLIDGTPVNEPGGAVDFSNYTLDSVDKIEIVHGATSALYGSDAMDGTVQIFTHRGNTRTPELIIEGDGGTFGTGHGSGQLSGLLGKFDYSASAAYFDTNGQGPNDFFRDTTLSGNFGWKFSDTDSLRLTLRDNASDAGQPGQTLLFPPVIPQSGDLHDFSANLSWNFMTGEHWQHQFSAFESRFQDTAVLPPPPPDVFVSKYNRAGVIGQSTYSFRNGGITAGYENEVETGPTASRHNQAGYLEVRYQLARRLTAIVGGRVEAHGFFGTRFVPRVGLSYAARDGSGFWGATRLRASYGQGIKEPEILPQDCSPQLNPEQSRTFDAGIDQYFASNRVRLSATFFHNDFRDIVSFAFVESPNCPAFGGSFFNTDKARSDGVNSSFEAKVTRWFSIAGNYSYDDSKVLTASNFFDPAEAAGNRLFHRPLHSANIVGNAHFLRMNWNIAGRYMGRQTDSDFDGLGISSDPSYVVWNLSNSIDLGHGLSTVARLENLFNRHYEEAVGYPALGFNYRLGLRYVWGGEK